MKQRLAITLILLGSAGVAGASQSVTLAWDQNSEPDIAGYRLKSGSSSGNYAQTIDVGNTTTATVSNLSAGSSTFFVVTAYNTAGLESLSSNEASFTAAPNQVPTISLTNPTAGSSFTAPASIPLSASAVDSDGSIARVEFYDATTKLGEAASSPYNFTWSGASAGTHTLTARAFDNQGASTASAPISVTVNPPKTGGLVAAYGFNESSGTSVTDASGNGNTGTITGATRIASGKYGGALSFNGSSNRVRINDSNSLDLTAGMTLEAWGIFQWSDP
jgi:hypothetical protein